MDSLLREGPKFVNGYIVEGKIVKAIIQQLKSQNKMVVKYETK